MRRVYVRAVGAVTPLGEDWASSLRALAAGRSAIAPVTRFDVEEFPCTVAAAVALDGDDRRSLFAHKAAREAWSAASPSIDPSHVGVFIGAESGRATMETVLALTRAAGGTRSFDHRRFGLEARAHAREIAPPRMSPAAIASSLARDLDARGPVETISLACASGAAAIAEAARAISLGECDLAVAGGVGADVDPFMLAGFGLLGALSSRGVSCPFDVRRDGFVVGEGAAMVVLSTEPSAVEVAGIGRSLDAHHLTAPDPEGQGAFAAMQVALSDGGMDSVEYVQAHGTSTPLNDAVEAAAIRRLLGDSVEHVSSIKGALGHWIAGAGAIGFLAAHAAISDGIVLPTAGLANPDESCALPHVTHAALQKNVSSALVNSFAFGGANCSLLLRAA